MSGRGDMGDLDAIVREDDLDAGLFHCCGDEDLYPYKCSACGHPLVFCYECDTLYPALPDTSVRHHDVNHFDPTRPSHACPRCGYAFEYRFMQNPAYAVTRREWRAAGLDALLLDARLRTALDELTRDMAPGRPVLRVHRHEGENPDVGHLTGNRAGLLRLARACLEAALAPNAGRADVVGPPALGLAAPMNSVASLFDMRSDMSLVGLTCEEPLERVDVPPALPQGFVGRHIGKVVGLFLLSLLALMIVGALTVVRWIVS